MGSILGGGTRIPHVLRPKTQTINNRSNVVANSMMTLKMVDIKKKKNFKKRLAEKMNDTFPIFNNKIKEMGVSGLKSIGQSFREKPVTSG